MKNNLLPAVNIFIPEESIGVVSDTNGTYTLKILSEKKIILVFSFIGYETIKKELVLNTGEKKNISIFMNQSAVQIQPVTVEDEQFRSTTFTRIDPKTISALPNVSGGMEAILKTLPGVASSSELSSQYSVRGGNYDENLVYVNDIEVYRPFLVRSGQQEGLSFINSDMISSILFSAGGFEAAYGDKMSSVLDIRYRKPRAFAGTINFGLLGGALHLEGGSKNHRLKYIVGLRQKNTRYLLNTFDTKGDYKPSFTDIQSYVTYDLSPEMEIAFLGNYSRNKYWFIPATRETRFGTVNQAYQFTIYFDGQEIDQYETMLGSLTATYQPNKKLRLKWITSAFQTLESETYDVQGQYWLDQIESDIGDSAFGEIAYNKGVGTYLNHARNNLTAIVGTVDHKGSYDLDNQFIQWGVKYRHEEINDKLSEWIMNDSAGYSLPRSRDSVLLQEVLKTSIRLSSNRYSAYFQNRFKITDDDNLMFILGARINYWDMNDEVIIDPRIGASFKPEWKKNMVFKASAGFYHQPPFYRELRDLNGKIYTNIKAQQSIHFVLGSDVNLYIWKRPFKYIVELYYKHLNNLIPYEIDDLRIRYLPQYTAKGYAAGIDMRINGEFVEGIESWFSLSVMQTQEDIIGDYYYEYYNKEGAKIYKGYTTDDIAVDSTRFEPGYIPRPTDQRVNASIFFQDYLPRLPTYKVHLNLHFGSRLPFGPPDHNRYKDTLRIPPYRRVDIGFSKQIFGKKGTGSQRVLKYFNSIWLTLEVYNLLQVSNIASYIWVKDINNTQYAVPNYLTGRQLNGRLIIKF